MSRLIIGSKECSFYKIVSVMGKSSTFSLLSSEWRNLAMELGLDSSVTDSIKRDILHGKTDVRGALQTVLCAWVNLCSTKGETPYLDVLCSTLMGMNLGKFADDLKNHFSSAMPVQQTQVHVTPQPQQVVLTPTQIHSISQSMLTEPAKPTNYAAPLKTSYAVDNAEAPDSRMLAEGYRVPIQPMAVMPVLDRDSHYYNMKHPKRGKAIIFSHLTFQNGQSARYGTEVDVSNLKKCLDALNFEVVIHRDLPKCEIYGQLGALKAANYSDDDCLLIIVLSHGGNDDDGRNIIYCADGDYYTEMLWNEFHADKCPTLAGKPKIFLIQACRGEQFDVGVKLLPNSVKADNNPVHQVSPYVVPNKADFLIAYSTADGHYSLRDETNGSWFIQAFTKVIPQYKDQMDLLSMMTVVSREVSFNFGDNVKQSPTIVSTLTRQIHF